MGPPRSAVAPVPPPSTERTTAADFDRHFALEIQRSERLRISLVAACALFSALVALAMPLFAPAMGRVRVVVLPATFALGVYEYFQWRYLDRSIRRGVRTAPLWPYLSVAVELTVISLAMLASSRRIGAAEAMLLPRSLSYLVVIMLATLQMNPRLSVFAGTLAAAEYLGVAVALGVLHAPRPDAPLLTAPSNFTGRVLVIALCGAISAFLASQIRRRCVSVLVAADERHKLLRFFPPATIERVLASPDAGVRTVDAEVTALFCDISAFTELAARLTPRATLALLNTYFSAVAEATFRHEGTLEKYIGDAVLAVWGAPVAHDDDADRAVRAALDMLDAVARLNASGALPEPLAVHIGLHTGPVAAGYVGTAAYVQYATVGDATNVASRVCAEARAGEVVITASTRERLGGRYAIEPRGPAALKGRSEPVALYRVGRGEAAA